MHESSLLSPGTGLRSEMNVRYGREAVTHAPSECAMEGLIRARVQRMLSAICRPTRVAHTTLVTATTEDPTEKGTGVAPTLPGPFSSDTKRRWLGDVICAGTPRIFLAPAQDSE